MTAYYNEHDPYAAEWLRNLIAAGRIAPGVVDSRSIEDVTPAELAGFTQCHFFAGVGVWSYALRRAGWPDDKPVWTGSCPCQPFSAAGKGDGFDDERHLWPAFHHLIEQRRPAVVFGEQVASKDAEPWLDLVQNDLEAMGYAVGAVPFPAAGIGAPHIRDRLYWVADHNGERFRAQGASSPEHQDAKQRSGAGRLGDDDDARLQGLGSGHQAEGGRHGEIRPATTASEFGGLADAANSAHLGSQPRSVVGLDAQGPGAVQTGLDAAGSTNGHWRDADWLLCRDGKWRPVEPGTFPLAHGATARVGRLRAYGNAIVAAQAEAFIRCYLEGVGA